MPVRTASTPTPGGPPHFQALATSTDQPAGTGARPTVCAASTSSGTPGLGAALRHLLDRLHGADLVARR